MAGPADPFVRMDDQIRSKMLELVRLEEEIRDKQKHRFRLFEMKWEADCDKENAEMVVRHRGFGEKAWKEEIEKACKDLETTKKLLFTEVNLETVASQCGDGFLCADMFAVRAFSEMVKLTGLTEKAVYVERSCPYYNEVMTEAKKLQLTVKEI